MWLKSRIGERRRRMGLGKVPKAPTAPACNARDDAELARNTASDPEALPKSSIVVPFGGLYIRILEGNSHKGTTN